MAGADADWNPGRTAIRADPKTLAKRPAVLFEPMLWGVFSLGGFITAFLLPVTIVVLFFAVPLGLWPAERVGYDAIARGFGDLLVRLFWFVLIGGSLFHGMHRLRHALLDAGLKKVEPLLNVVLYGVAILGTLGALWYTLLFDAPLPFR